jgi:tetratricopeptide (TPR) repeat protein
MHFLKKLLGLGGDEPAASPSGAPPTIRVFDEYGRALEVPREEWRTKILPGHFRERWDKPNELADAVTQALGDEFAAEALEPARRLSQIDPNPQRGATLLAVTLLQLKRHTEAEEIAMAALRQHGEDGVLLTNLAKAQAGKGDAATAERTLWHALEVDPNQENGLLWYAAIERERGGITAERAAFAKVAALAHSWRAQLWLARAALDEGNVGAALDLYRQALARVDPAPADLLMQLSGDLGNRGRLAELIELCAPRFDVRRHGLMVGNNLIKSYLSVGEVTKARAILEQLYAQRRPDWRETLTYWDGEVDKATRNYGPVETSEQLVLTALRFDTPIWASEALSFKELLPTKPDSVARVCFVARSAEVPSEHGDRAVVQQSEAAGRFTRALPLFLVEQMYVCTELRPVFLLPWISKGGFVLAGKPWSMEPLSGVEADYAVFLHAVCTTTPWRVRLSLVRPADRSIIAEWEHTIDPLNASAAITQILETTIDRVTKEQKLAPAALAGDLRPPRGPSLVSYVIGLEQTLAIVCASEAADPSAFLYQERAILDNLLQLAVAEPANAPARLLMLSAFEREARRRPDVVRDYRTRLERLAREHPLPEPINTKTDAAVAAISARLPSLH